MAATQPQKKAAKELNFAELDKQIDNAAKGLPPSVKEQLEDHVAQKFKEGKQVAKADTADKVTTGKSKVVPINSPLPLKFRSDPLPWNYGDIQGDPKPPALTSMVDVKFLTKEEVDACPTPCVIINGIQITPTATDIPLQHGRLGRGSSAQMYVPFYHKGVDKKVFSRFVAEIDGRTVEFFLDDKSKVVINAPFFNSGRYDSLAASAMNSTLVLLNSSSIDDSVIGDNYLLNVASKSNVLNRSQLAGTRMFTGPRDYMFNESNEKPDDMDTVPRQKHENCQFKEARITDSELSPGYYSRSTVNQSKIKSSRTVYVRHCELTKATYDGKSVTMTRVNSVSMSVTVEGEITLQNLKLNNEYLHARALYMPNKFAALTVDFPVQELKMIRTSVTEVELSFYQTDSVRFNLTPTREEVLEGIRDLMKRNNHSHSRTPAAENPFTESFLEYAADAIVSRLGVIVVMDAATAVVNEMNHRYNDYDDPYMF